MTYPVKWYIITAIAFIGCKNRYEEIPVASDAIENTERAEAIIKQNNGNDTPIFDFGTKNIQLPKLSVDKQKLNPPHGEPGHRCDIAVGAPLPNTNIASTENQIPTALQASNNNQTIADTSTKSIQINPPHGEPGHRCDIAVGAPLNTATEQKMTTPQVTSFSTNIPKETPSAVAQITDKDFSGKPNPPHGEIGHRCDIVVGAILP